MSQKEITQNKLKDSFFPKMLVFKEKLNHGDFFLL